MGRAKQLKQMRKIARDLPKIMVGHVQASVVEGHELIAKGTTELSNGDPVNAKDKYIAKKTVPTPLNHERKMKEAYNKGGVKMASAYAGGIIRYDQAKKQAEFEAEKKRKEESAAAQEGEQNKIESVNPELQPLLNLHETPGDVQTADPVTDSI